MDELSNMTSVDRTTIRGVLTHASFVTADAGANEADDKKKTFDDELNELRQKLKQMSLQNGQLKERNVQLVNENMELNTKIDTMEQQQLTDSNVTQLLLTDSNVTQLLLTDSNVTQLLLTDSNVTQLLLTDSNVTQLLLTDSNVTQLLLTDSNVTQLLNAAGQEANMTRVTALVSDATANVSICGCPTEESANEYWYIRGITLGSFILSLLDLLLMGLSIFIHKERDSWLHTFFVFLRYLSHIHRCFVGTMSTHGVTKETFPIWAISVGATECFVGSFVIMLSFNIIGWSLGLNSLLKLINRYFRSVAVLYFTVLVIFYFFLNFTDPIVAPLIAALSTYVYLFFFCLFTGKSIMKEYK
uniref:Uncharacterized protein n=1 Tax=Globodera rostochiensis TaxID=31243 RepID=A0A914GPF0_GLORO